jgi:hypothetical protein
MAGTCANCALPVHPPSRELRGRSGIIGAGGRWLRADCVTPIAAEIVSPNVDGVYFGVADLEASGIGVGTDLALHLQPGVGCGGGNELEMVWWYARHITAACPLRHRFGRHRTVRRECSARKSLLLERVAVNVISVKFP